MLLSDRDSLYLQQIQCPVLDFIGTADPDFADAEVEAAWLRSVMPQDEVHLLPKLGHYPHREDPQSVLPDILKFAQTVFPSLLR
jgi:pimeloyl-ACP methyl ester carboxylesterase